MDAPLPPEQQTVVLPQGNQNRWVAISWRLLEFVKRTLWVFFFCVLGYLLVALVGLWPANAGFRPSESGIELRVISNAVHTDIIFPIITDVVDWREQFPLSQFANWRCIIVSKIDAQTDAILVRNVIGFPGQFELRLLMDYFREFPKKMIWHRACVITFSRTDGTSYLSSSPETCLNSVRSNLPHDLVCLAARLNRQSRVPPLRDAGFFVVSVEKNECEGCR